MRVKCVKCGKTFNVEAGKPKKCKCGSMHAILVKSRRPVAIWWDAKQRKGKSKSYVIPEELKRFFG